MKLWSGVGSLITLALCLGTAVTYPYEVLGLLIAILIIVAGCGMLIFATWLYEEIFR